MYTYVYIHALNKIICSVRNDFDLETFLKVTAYLLIDNTIWEQHEPNLTKEREHMIPTRIF